MMGLRGRCPFIFIFIERRELKLSLVISLGPKLSLTFFSDFLPIFFKGVAAILDSSQEKIDLYPLKISHRGFCSDDGHTKIHVWPRIFNWFP